MDKKAVTDDILSTIHVPWEYRLVSKGKIEMPFPIFLDLMGADGWELVAVDKPDWVFKRKRYRRRGRRKEQ